MSKSDTTPLKGNNLSPGLTSFDASKAADEAGLEVKFREGLWEGRVPLHLALASDEILGQAPPPLFIHIPRVSYLPALTSKIRSHFLSQMAAHEDCIWFEEPETGVPLKWETPAGVLFDLFSTNQLPWKLTVHFQRFPEDKLMRLRGPDSLKQIYFTTLKQAVFLQHNSANRVLKLERTRQNRLWQAVTEGKLFDFLGVAKAFTDPSSDGPANVEPSYPLRVYLRGFGDDVDLRPLQRRLSSKTPPEPSKAKESHPTFHPRTLGDALYHILPGLQQMDRDSYEVVMHGLRDLVPLDTDLAWLLRQMRNPDFYLHITIRRCHRVKAPASPLPRHPDPPQVRTSATMERLVI